jgi:CheY-like chemotaxis protein
MMTSYLLIVSYLLSVDGEEIVRDTQKKYLDFLLKDVGKDCVIEVAKDGQQALEKIHARGGEYKLILLDAKISGVLSSLDLYNILKRDYPNQSKRIVWVAGWAEEIEQLLQKEKFSCLRKPFQISQFRKAVAPYLYQNMDNAVYCDLPDTVYGSATTKLLNSTSVFVH